MRAFAILPFAFALSALAQTAEDSGSSSPQTYDTCTLADNACRTAAGANQATCSASYCSCLAEADAIAQGPAYCQTASTTVVASPVATVPAAVETDAGSDSPQTYDTCTAADNTCRTAAGANQASCSSDYCACLDAADALAQGPAYCQAAASTTVVASPVATVVASSVAASTIVASPVATVPAAVETDAGSDSPETFETCTAADNACRTAEDANQASCSAALCSCLDAAGALAQGPAYCQTSTTAVVSPVATAPAATSVAAEEDAGDDNDNDSDAETIAVVVTPATSVASSAPVATDAGSSSETFDSCTTADNACRTAEDANQASCSAALCSCLASAGADALAQGPAYCQTTAATTAVVVASTGAVATGAAATATAATLTIQTVATGAGSATAAATLATYTGAAAKTIAGPLVGLAGLMAMFL